MAVEPGHVIDTRGTRPDGASARAVVVDIESVAAGGAGVGRMPDGRVVFVHRTAPGDRVRVRPTRTRRSYALGRLEELLAPGPGRREAPCPHYPRCGGCQLQHLEYAAQLEAKSRIVRDALERIAGVSGPAPTVEPSPSQLRYRNRLTLTLRRLRGGRVVAGFHRLERPGRIVDVGDDCLLPVSEVADAWRQVREGWGPGAARLPGGPGLRLTLQSTGNGVIVVVEGGEGEGDPDDLVGRAPGVLAVWKRDAGGPRLLAGPAAVELEWMGERVGLRGGAFLQVNREAAARLYSELLGALGDPRGRRVMDAYCGVGAIGRLLARRGATVTGIESDPAAVASARSDPVPGFEVLEGSVERQLAAALPADVVIVNPPRSGLDRTVAEVLSESRVPRVLYVSCDPATLARDVGRLAPAFRLRTVRAFDLFPQTAHVETLATFVRSGDDDA